MSHEKSEQKRTSQKKHENIIDLEKSQARDKKTPFLGSFLALKPWSPLFRIEKSFFHLVIPCERGITGKRLFAGGLCFIHCLVIFLIFSRFLFVLCFRWLINLCFLFCSCFFPGALDDVLLFRPFSCVFFRLSPVYRMSSVP